MMGTKARYAGSTHQRFCRHLERTLDLTFVREFVHETYAHSGRPSVDPIVFFKLQLVMFFENIRSERLLMRHAEDRLSVRWYLGYDLNEPLPDHSMLSKIRRRYGLDAFRRFFDTIIEQCQQAKLVWGKELYFDSSAASMQMLIWIPWLRVLRWRHERLFKSTWQLFLNQNQYNLRRAWNSS